MALPNAYANIQKQTQQGIYPGSGVAQGGQVGRSPQMTGGSPAVHGGGANIAGSGFKPLAIPKLTPLPALKPLAVLRAAAMTKSAGPAVRPVVTMTKSMAPAPVGGFPAGTFPAPSVVHVAPPVAPVGPAVPAVGAIVTHDPGWMHDIAQANYNYDMAGQPITGWNADLAANIPKYELGTADQNHQTQMDAEASNAALAAHGTLQGSGYVNAFTDRQAAYNHAMADLSAQYGPAMAAQLRGQIDAAEGARAGQRTLDNQTADQAAWQRFMDNLAANPPAAPSQPIEAPVVNAPKAPTSAPARQVTVRGGVATKGMVPTAPTRSSGGKPSTARTRR